MRGKDVGGSTHKVCAPGIRGLSPQPAVAGKCRVNFLYLVLGDMAESALRQSLLMFQGSLLIFLLPVLHCRSAGAGLCLVVCRTDYDPFSEAISAGQHGTRWGPRREKTGG